jgi:hypothetical protein
MDSVTIEDIETRFNAALVAGDYDSIDAIGRELDTADDAERKAKPKVSILQAALWYASVGLHVFPLKPAGKIPYPGTHGCKDATTDEAAIREWWDRWPDSNLGIATGIVVDVIDIDGPAGHQQRALHWDDIFAKVDNDSLGKVLTPRPGGMHIYVPATGDGNSASLLPSIDYRGVGGYVVAPPSSVVTDAYSGTYTWLNSFRTPAEAA